MALVNVNYSPRWFGSKQIVDEAELNYKIYVNNKVTV